MKYANPPARPWFTLYRLALLVALLLSLSGCQAQQSAGGQGGSPSTGGAAQSVTRPISSEDLEFVTGQRLYIPAYSEVFNADENSTLNLTVTLSVRNTDPDSAIVIESIQYYDTAGALVREYIETPLELSPMATTEVIVSRKDRQGGTGANFIVEWGAEELVYEPIVEALMISTAAQQGISFLTTARVLDENR